ncbi:hypothetical protein [Xanthomonas oryzae]|uniref:hypothetical protein n=1 Tax=Xanthomonas oryzae TaxID=347 RepID=UPI000CA04605|nr:hypothetical protein [Xanthomonas oryzae]RBA76990.1 hypothetical protein BRO09_07795 [Xanthomonas oryzae pv. oryzae]RBB11986.1 hypothetical protein BRO12_09800 [Xanthomonas oryzae pv. oryzae]RBB19255.1 hypothetical protein BRN97_00615 [Xanthomonas oryzae pv. oryzae]RBB24070.1 hypothetical protein BRO13_03345 [Xanthomonas oryzae pv. oryzae]RBB29609.1 hypothetical protein BRO04_02905 [Xanthomonas oryzae pv. oryzae]
MKDQELHQKIGQLLFDVSPSDASKIIVRAKLFEEGDGGSYEFDYLNGDGVLGWFDPDAKKIGTLTDYLAQLRENFRENKFFKNERPWVGANIVIDVSKSKISIDFIYE